LTTPEAFNRPEVVFAVPSGSWSESVAREAAPKATLKQFGQSTSADLIQEVVAGRADAVVMDTPIQITRRLAAYGDKLRVVPGRDKPLDIKACHVGLCLQEGRHQDARLCRWIHDEAAWIRPTRRSRQAVHDGGADQGNELSDASNA